MSIEKSELKMATTRNIGIKADDRLEAAKAELHRFEGARSALIQAAKTIEELFKHIQADADAGKLAEFGDNVLKVNGLIVGWVRRALGACISLGDVAESNKLRCQGKIEALEATVADLKKMYDEEHAKAEALKSTPSTESGEVIPIRGRPEGAHPGMSLAQRRKAEEAAAERVHAADPAAPHAKAATPKAKSTPTVKPVIRKPASKPKVEASGDPDTR